MKQKLFLICHAPVLHLIKPHPYSEDYCNCYFPLSSLHYKNLGEFYNSCLTTLEKDSVVKELSS